VKMVSEEMYWRMYKLAVDCSWLNTRIELIQDENYLIQWNDSSL
jgi:hypothetical protein